MTTDLFSRLAGLPIEVDGLQIRGCVHGGAGWDRRTTVVEWTGAGIVGSGEDVNYDPAEQATFQERDLAVLERTLELPRRSSFGDFCLGLDRLDLFSDVLGRTDMRLYRRWAFESAALDLCLRQNGLGLGAALGIEPKPLRFVASMGLPTEGAIARLEAWLAQTPDLRFKLDYAAHWDRHLVAELAAFGRVDVVDLKGLYRSGFMGPPADAEGYRAVVEGLPDVFIEDPEINDSTRAALAPARDRITWDANLHSLQDLWQIEDQPRVVNIKPSRFGTVEEVLRVVAFCEARGIGMYGGGQYELDCGRGQIQRLASLFYSGMPNDTAPVEYHAPSPEAALPTSPLTGDLLADLPGF